MPAKAAGTASVSSPPPLPSFDPWELLEINLNAMREHYRMMPNKGPDQDDRWTTMELAHTDLLAAVSAARKGERWKPPGR